jgi:hypothetical protein
MEAVSNIFFQGNVDADLFLRTFRDFVGFQSTVTLTSSWLIVYGIDRSVAVIRNWKWIAWAKNKGFTAAIVQRFNLALILFLPLTILGGALNLVSQAPEYMHYHDAYRPLHVALSLLCLGLIVFNFYELTVRAFEQGSEEKLWERLRFAHEKVSERGVRLLPLMGTPLVFFLPSELLIDWLRVFLR